MGGIEQRAKWVESSFRVSLLFHAGAGDFPVILPRRHLLQPSPKTDSTSLLPTSTPLPLAAFIPKSTLQQHLKAVQCVLWGEVGSYGAEQTLLETDSNCRLIFSPLNSPPYFHQARATLVHYISLPAIWPKEIWTICWIAGTFVIFFIA